MADQKILIVSGVRTPIASFKGSFTSVSSVELGKIAAAEAIRRSGISPADVEEVFVGSVMTAGAGQNVARQIALGVGIPDGAQSVTVNKVCSSSMKALALAFLSIRSGYRKLTLVGGTENMSQVPFYLPRSEIPYGGTKIVDGIVRDGLEDATLLCPMGQCAEKSAKDFEISRQAQDEFAIGSYKKAAAAWENGLFNEEVTPVTVTSRRGNVVVAKDEEFSKLIESKVPLLSPVFVKDGTGTITAANASSLNDGAIAAVVASESAVPQGTTPLAEILSFAEAGGAPVDFTIAPIGAVQKLLKENNLSAADIALWEVNEAFSVTVLGFIKALQLDPSKVNVKGGAVALGHPLGMSGLRVVISLIYSLKPNQLGIAAICNGGGEAMAFLVKRV